MQLILYRLAYYKQIDAFRFFAAFLVLMAHWLTEVAWIEDFMLGRMGVEFFFVISGFLISKQLLQMKSFVEERKISFWQAFKTFFVRRALRIFPLYYFLLIVVTLANKGQLLEAFWWNLSYTSNFYFIKIGAWTRTFSHFWSLSVEEHFYLVWPFLVLLLARKLLPQAMLVIIAIALAFRWYVCFENIDYFVAYAHTISCLDLFMFGGLLAYFLRTYPERFQKVFSSIAFRWGTAILFIVILCISAFWADLHQFRVVYLRTILGYCFAILLGVLVVGIKGPVGKILEHKWLILLGKLSYAIYLLHNFVPGMLLGLKKAGLPNLVLVPLYLITTVALSYILYRLIEIPMRRLNRHFPMPKRDQ